MRARKINDDLDVSRIEAVVREWPALLPQPFKDADCAAGYDYDLSICRNNSPACR